MRITILETGRPPGRLAELYPSYPDMFAALFARLDVKPRIDVVSVLDGAPLPDLSVCGPVLITGSPAAVYDPLPWLDPLRRFVGEAATKQLPLVGVCFGHQIIADALGGRVSKSEKGWGVGRHSYRILQRRPWMAEADESFALAASHQDQVVMPPEGATTLASSNHTEYALLAWEDAPILTMQGHPEFTDAFAAALYNARRDVALSDAEADAAIESLAQPEDQLMVAGWMLRVLRG